MPEELEVVGGDDDAEQGEQAASPQEQVHEPAKLMRIAVMLRELQEEVRRASPDEEGRARLREVHDRALGQLKGVLSEPLQEELDLLALPFNEQTPSESEIRISQAQLIGWLEGLFQGIQAAIFNQQVQARQQLEHMRRQRQIGPGGPSDGSGSEQPQQQEVFGHYL